MSTGRHVDWKLIFKADETYPGQRFTCVVEVAHPFKGFFLVISNPEAFSISALNMGNVNQLVAGADVPCVALNRQPLILPVCMPLQHCTMEVLNTETPDASKLTKVPEKFGNRERMRTRLVPTPFRAELHGKILIGNEDDTPVPTPFEGAVVDGDKPN